MKKRYLLVIAGVLALAASVAPPALAAGKPAKPSMSGGVFTLPPGYTLEAQTGTTDAGHPIVVNLMLSDLSDGDNVLTTSGGGATVVLTSPVRLTKGDATTTRSAIVELADQECLNLYGSDGRNLDVTSLDPFTYDIIPNASHVAPISVTKKGVYTVRMLDGGANCDDQNVARTSTINGATATVTLKFVRV